MNWMMGDDGGDDDDRGMYKEPDNSTDALFMTNILRSVFDGTILCRYAMCVYA